MIANFFVRLSRGARLGVAAVRRHAVVAGVGGALLAASAGGGIGYAMSRPASTPMGASTLASSSPQATPGPKAKHERGRGAMALRGLIALVAKDTHQTRAQVLAELKTGKSLDDIAGSSAATIRQTILSKLQARLDAAVTAGKITKDQEAKRLAAWKTMLEKVMSTPGTSLPFGKHSRPAAPATSAATAA